MHYLKDKHQQLEDYENQLDAQYKNKRFKISPSKKSKPRGKKITISNLEKSRVFDNSHKKEKERNKLTESNLDATN